MKVIFDRATVDPAIPGIILMSHGPLAGAILDSALLVYGEVKNSAALCLEAGDDPNAFTAEFAEVLNAFPAGAVVLMDILGGTPSNCFLRHCHEQGIKLHGYVGMNLTMLIEAADARSCGEGEDVFAELGELAAQAVKDVGAIL